MSKASQWKVVNGNQATVRPADAYTPVTLANPVNMLATPDSRYVLTLNGNGIAYVYDSTADTYVASRQLITATGNQPLQGYYGVLGSSPNASFLLVNGLIVNSSLVTLGGSATPGAVTVTPGAPGAGGFPGGPGIATVINTGQRNVASVAGLN